MKVYDWKNDINKKELKEVVNTLKNNGIIVFPTETVYGIGGNALSTDVIDRVYEIKQRPREKALNIILSSKERIGDYAEVCSFLEQKIIDKCMPGPITIILKKKNNFGKSFTASNDTIGIRIPDHKIIKAILDELNFPLIAPSANISGCESGIDVSNIINDFKNKVEIIIDGGNIQKGLPSTIVQVIEDKIIILRQGEMTAQEIYDRIGEKITKK